MFGQLGFFHKFAGRDIEDKRPLDAIVDESKRLLGVLETRLDGRDWIMGDDYTIADISMLGWVRNLIGFYGAGELVDFDVSRMCRPGWSAASPARRCSAASKFRSGRHNRNEKGRPRGRPFTRLAC